MTAPAYYVLDGDVAVSGDLPRRPGINDLGGAAFVDDQPYSPDPTEFPSALDENQQERVLVGVCRVTPVAIVNVQFTGSTPVIASATVAAEVLNSATFTPTDNGLGDTTITWPANVFPASTTTPKITYDSDGAWLPATYVLVTNGVRVKTRNSSGTFTDANFRLEISGQSG